MREYRIISKPSVKSLAESVTEALNSPPGSGPCWELYEEVFLSHNERMYNQAMTKEPNRVYGGKYHDMLLAEDGKDPVSGEYFDYSDELAQRELEDQDEEFGPVTTREIDGARVDLTPKT